MFEPLASLDVTLAQFPEVCMCCGYDRDSMYTAQVGFVLVNGMIKPRQCGGQTIRPRRTYSETPISVNEGIYLKSY